MASDKSEYIKLFFLPPTGISNLDDPVQRYFLHYIFVPGINHVNLFCTGVEQPSFKK